MNVKISVFVTCIKTIISWLLYKLHECTFKTFIKPFEISQRGVKIKFKLIFSLGQG